MSKAKTRPAKPPAQPATEEEAKPSHPPASFTPPPAYGRVTLWHPRGVWVELPVATTMDQLVFYKRAYDCVDAALSVGFLVSQDSTVTMTMDDLKGLKTEEVKAPKKPETYEEWCNDWDTNLALCNNVGEINDLLPRLRLIEDSELRTRVWNYIADKIKGDGFKYNAQERKFFNPLH